MLIILVKYSLIVLLLGCILLCIIPRSCGEYISIIIFWFTFMSYIQAMFMNQELSSFRGQEIYFSPKLKTFNIMMWLLGLILIVLIIILAKNNWKSVLVYVGCFLVAVQLVSQVVLTINYLQKPKNEEYYVTTDGMLEMSSDRNVIVFILDTFDGMTMESILNRNDGYLTTFPDFTYFPNCTSVHSRTYPAITSLLTGEVCHFDKEVEEWVNGAYENSQFISDMYLNNVDVGLYTSEKYLSCSLSEILCNYKKGTPKVIGDKMIRSALKMTLFRDLPYCFKDFFIYTSSDINFNVVESTNKYYQGYDELFYSEVESNGISTNAEKSCFRFYHLAGPHRDLTHIEDAAEDSLKSVCEFMEEMKRVGVYDNSTIIITTDHGHSGGDSIDREGRPVPILMMVKPYNVRGEKMNICENPISQTDFIPTVLAAFDIDTSNYKYQKSFFDIKDENRKRYYYYTGLISDEEGEIVLREYEVLGDARNGHNYTFTGNEWEVKYSDNRVASKSVKEKYY